MLQQMRSYAKYVWLLVFLTFVGGFLLYQTSGLTGRTALTATTPVAVVNGHDILFSQYDARVQQEIAGQEGQRREHTLSEDDKLAIENDVFDQMVMEVLLSQEYKRRGITVSDEEIKQYAQTQAPEQFRNQPAFLTNGQFDFGKYQRYLSTSVARQNNVLAYLDQYFRTEIPRQKLLDQVASGIYIPFQDLWRTWRDEHDSVQVSYVAFRPTADSAAAKSISDAELRNYFDAHKEQFRRAGRAALSVLTIPRVVSAADTAVARDRILKLRAEIVGGAKFEDVAKRESADTAGGNGGSAAQGGSLPRAGKGTYVPEFEKALAGLKVGELSQPVLTAFGFHLIRLDDRKGDSVTAHHILIPIQISDSATTRTDKEADSLANLTASADDPKKFDAAAAKLHLTPIRVQVTENEPATHGVQAIPSVSAWAFRGVKVGESSELFDDDNGYYLARLDSISEGGDPNFDTMKEDVRARVAAEKAIEAALPAAQKFAAAAATGFENAAKQLNLTVAATGMFSRSSSVPGLGQVNEAIGAAFGLPVGAVSMPVKTSDGVFVMRIDKRITADSAAWEKQKDIQRQIRTEAVRNQRIQLFLQDLKGSANVVDKRKEVNAAQRRQST